MFYAKLLPNLLAMFIFWKYTIGLDKSGYQVIILCSSPQNLYCGTLEVPH